MIKTMTVLSALLSLSTAMASEGHGPKVEEQKLAPAKAYNGNTPIDRSNGLPFNNGTYGLTNAEHEEWAKIAVLVPGLSEKPYTYEQRDRLIASVQFQVEWAKAALANYETLSADTLPEAKAHATQAVEALSPAAQRLEDAAAKLKSAGRGDWDSAQGDARRAIINFRLSYMQMHKNAHL